MTLQILGLQSLHWSIIPSIEEVEILLMPQKSKPELSARIILRHS